MKRLDFSSKKLDNDMIIGFFKENPIIGSMGRKYQYIELIFEAAELHQYSLEKIQQNYHTRIHQNFIINLVSAVEIHLKELIKLNATNWNKDFYSELLSDKISLENAFKIFKEIEISREAIISKNSSFNSLDSIIKIFSKLTKSSIVHDISNVKYMKGEDVSLIQIFPNWQSNLAKLFEVRNSIVHEGFSAVELNSNNMHIFHHTTLMFMFAIDYYCINNNFNS